MATSVTLNSLTYSIPAQGENTWGTQVSNYLIAISTSVLQKSGGSFTLTSDIDFGASYGVLSPYFKAKDGTAAAPSLSFSGDTNTGFFRPGDDTLGVATGGVEAFRVDSSGATFTGNVQLGDRISVGGITGSTSGFLNRGNITGGTSAMGTYALHTVSNDVTSAAYGFRSNIGTQDAAFTLNSLNHYYAAQGTKGSASTLTSQFGFRADSSLTGATNNYGFYSDIAAATNRWNFYAAGTADNYFEGNVGIGRSPLVKLHLRDDTTTSGDTPNPSFILTRQNTNTEGLALGNDGDNNVFISANNAALRFLTNVGGTYYDRLQITSAGIVDVKNELRLSGSSSGYVGLKSAAAAGSTTYTLPAADGAEGSVLSTNGSATLSWAAPLTNPMTTEGDLIVGGTAGAATRATKTDLIATSSTPGFVPAYERTTVSLVSVGSFTSDSGNVLTIVRVGDVVTITSPTLLHSATATPTATSVIPERFRPTIATAVNCFNTDGTGTSRVEVGTGGTFLLSHRAPDGSALNASETSRSGVTITYIVN
ncbi:MAG: hypothetical protein ACOH5I_26475 [Oligoflexus sp.]